MATFRVRLRRNQGSEIADLPPLCIRCGAPATRTFHKTFSQFLWHRQRVALPLCEKHWFLMSLLRYYPFMYFGVAFVTIAGMGFLRIVASLPDQVTNLVWYQFYGFIAVYIISKWVLQYRAIKVTKITEHTIDLTNVALPFVEAVEEEEQDLRSRLPQDTSERFKSPTSEDDRISPGGDDGYRSEV
jgi:hypothetical protein